MSEQTAQTDDTLCVGSCIHVPVDSNVLPQGSYRVITLPTMYAGNCQLKQLKDKPTNRRAIKRWNLGIYEISKARLDEMLKEFHATRISWLNPMGRLSEPDNLSGKRAEIYKQRKPILLAMTEPDTLHRLLGADRPRVLSRLCAEHKVKPRQATRLFERLLEFGLDWQLAATTAHDRCGRRKGGTYSRKLGRPRKRVANGRAPHQSGINATPEIRKCIEVFALSQYRRDISVASNYRTFKTNYCTRRAYQLSDGLLLREALPEDQVITVDQFRYHLKCTQEEQLRLLNHTGKPIAGIRENRLALGSAREGLLAPGYRLIIDCTLADVYLVSAWDRTRIIGRPVVYVVIDASTSTIVGLHITLYSPSAAQAKIALYRALTDKSAWLAKFGLCGYLELFPCAPIPYALIYDRGEVHSNEGDEVRHALGIAAGIPAPYMAEWKAIVERSFKTSNDFTIHWSPGSTQGRLRERGERDVRLDAVLTLHEFSQLMLHNVFWWNLMGSITAKMHPEALAQQIAPSPVGLFTWGLKNLHGTHRYLERDRAVRTLLPSVQCAIGDRGVFSDRLRWTAPWMNDFALPLVDKDAKSGRLFLSPDLADTAFVHLGDEQHLRPVELGADFRCGEDYFPEDVIDVVAYENDTRAIYADQNQAVETELHAASHEVVARASHLTKAALHENPQPKSKRTAQIKDNRAAEIATMDIPSAAVKTDQNRLSASETLTSSTSQAGGTDLMQFLQSIS